MQNSVCFTNPCINLLVLSSAIREYHLKILELLDQLQCITTYLHHILTWINGEA